MSVQKPSPDEPTAARPLEARPFVAPLQLTPGTILGDRYRIVSLIGSGGMGQVYRADDLKLGQSVALKFLAHGDVRRLYEEVRIGRQVSHPNVCRFYDIAEVDGYPFITMEFVDGEDLASLLRRVGRLPSEKALAVSRDVCAGVAAAHEKGVVHRDLKPANVMIDGRGRARVTDFGLAVAGERTNDGAGTLVYMAPEQLAGEPATMKSDIYAIGLVMYELFTGRRAFESAKRGEVTRPSLITKDVPPAIEQMIARCLDVNPDARPDSAADLLHEIPGDPLAAAIARGETPSPAMVAAAAKSGDLAPAVAWTLMTLALAGLFGGATLSSRTLLERGAVMKAPEVLLERARGVLTAAGVRERPADSDIFPAIERGSDRLTYVYRQSPWPMRPLNADGVLRKADPPLGGTNQRIDGMANVEVDDEGNLLRFEIAPPAFEKPPVAAAPDWQPFMSAAAYDPKSLIPVAPQWSSRVDSDQKSAWLARDGRRIETASYHGRPVSFELLTPSVASAPYFPEQLATAMFIAFLILLPAAAFVLARTNLRRRQGDRAGAVTTATFFLIVSFIGFVFAAHHSLRFVSEWIIISWNLAQSTFWALIAATMYIAIEPFVRKRWPEILISWTRLLAGRFNDPMVGRDIVAGAALAGVVIIVWHATLIVSGASVFFTAPESLGPWRFIVSGIAKTLVESLLRGMGLVVLLAILRGLTRNDFVAAALTTVFVAAMTLGDTFGPPWLRMFYAVPATVAAVALARQFGLLAVMSYAFIVLLEQRMPLTLDPDAWFFSRSAIVTALLVVFIAAAFRISLGARRWLPDMGSGL